MTIQITDLFNQFDKTYRLSDQCKLRLMQSFKMEEVTRRKHWLKSGQTPRKMGFVQKGLLISYTFDDRQTSGLIMKEGDLCVIPYNFFRQRPSESSIQALEDSALFTLDFAAMQDILRQFPEFHHIIEAYLLNTILSMDTALQLTRMNKTEKRLSWLRKNTPDLLQRMPAAYLASYIGITPSTFSKVINGK